MTQMAGTKGRQVPVTNTSKTLEHAENSNVDEDAI